MLSLNELIGFGAGGDDSHSYWRMLFTGACTNTDLATAVKVEFRAESGGADLCSGGTAIASYTDGSYPPSYAFDTIPSYWKGNPAGASGQWIGYQFAAPVKVAEGSLTVLVPTIGALRYWATAMALEWSDDGTNWTRVKGVTGLPASNPITITL